MKTKILYCITKGNWGGAQKYVFDLATSLPKDSYDISVLLGADGPLAQKLQTAGIQTIILGHLTRDINIFTDFFAFWRLFIIIKKERPDIIHLNSSKMGFMGSLVSRLLGIKRIIFTGHGWAFNEDRNKFQKKIIHLLHLLTIFFSHQTIAVSNQTKNQVSRSKYFTKKIVVINNGLGEIDYLDKETARKLLLEKLGQDNSLSNRLWLGTISELHKNKGLKYIIEALYLIKIKSPEDVELPILMIIGDGEKKNKLQERINRYNLNDTVFLVGQIDEAQKYLKAFDIFTLTSITEALPYVILEAGKAGLPIIASNVGGIPEIINDMKDGILVRPKEPEEIVRVIEFLRDNPEKRLILGQNIQTRISTDFSQESMVKKTMELYNR
jgi:glycosyltransferase involved in cell wall biosynthesis